jgi:hypothetical protein
VQVHLSCHRPNQLQASGEGWEPQAVALSRRPDWTKGTCAAKKLVKLS